MNNSPGATTRRASPRPRARYAPRAGHPADPDALDVPALEASITHKLAGLREEHRSMLITMNQTLHENIHWTGDHADIGARSFANEQALQLMNSRLQLIAQMERAIQRIDEGGYGQCESCHCRIGAERIEAFPAAPLCVPCKMAEEHY